MYHEGVKVRLALTSLLVLGTSACQLVFGLDQYGPAQGGASATSAQTGGSTTGGAHSCCVLPSSDYKLVEVTGALGSAAPPQPCAAPQRFFGGQPPIDSCTGCSCDLGAAACHASAKCFGSGDCTGTSVSLSFGKAQICQAANNFASVSSCKLDGPPIVAAPATPGGGTLVAGPWETQYALCPVEGMPSGCASGESCPQTGANTRLCLLAAHGTSVCPTGFEDLVKIYAGGSDQQQCACTCNTDCSFDVKFGTACVNSAPLDASQCTGVGNAYSYTVKPLPTATATDGVSGNFAPSAPETLCCKKSG